jgi:hypothetical protein
MGSSAAATPTTASAGTVTFPIADARNAAPHRHRSAPMRPLGRRHHATTPAARYAGPTSAYTASDDRGAVPGRRQQGDQDGGERREQPS